ncbi:hypothetical protein [Leptospira ilyithenensis]|uniref:Uncharacterized protein n=1 Tax=Leptospira ilyithenensis TaxID=2484901 RepID=A0A4R9LTB2_9LEPT|nr:hypothetical protein [Leptospira ilyithenensis]TGN13345.1 hypothetical protein EHS11_03695 [Leptospira ilyithenensis]
MGSASAKILVFFSLISATVLAFNCNLFCELNELDKVAISLQLDVEPCHNSQETDESAGCEWDSGRLDVSDKDKLTNFSVFFSLVQYYIPFSDRKTDLSADLSDSIYFKVFLFIPSYAIQNINSVRIII